ncbi:KOW motif-containing protein [Lacticaseibacillus camelliae]
MPDEVASILHSQGMATTHSTLSFEVGETITIIAGAFAGMKGKITANDPDKQKLKATINMFEREVSADLDYDQVDKL